MKKISKPCAIIIFITILLCVFVLWQCLARDESESEGMSTKNALKVLNHYKPSQVHVILVGVHSGTASGRYYLLNREDDAELFQEFIEMFWADDAVYEEKNPFSHSNPSWQITFVDTTGKMLTLDVFFAGEEVGYEGKHFVQSKINNSVVNQLIQEKK